MASKKVSSGKTPAAKPAAGKKPAARTVDSARVAQKSAAIKKPAKKTVPKASKPVKAGKPVKVAKSAAVKMTAVKPTAKKPVVAKPAAARQPAVAKQLPCAVVPAGERQVAALRAVCSISPGLCAGRAVVKTLSDALAEFSKAFGFTRAAILELSADETSLAFFCAYGDTPGESFPIDEPVEILAESGAARLLGKVWTRGACLPLVFQDTPKGLLCFAGGDRLNADEKRLLELFAQQVTLTLYASSLDQYPGFAVDFPPAQKTDLLSEPTPAILGFTASLHLLRGPEGCGDFHDFYPLPNGCVAITIGKTSGRGEKDALNLEHLVPTVRSQLAAGHPLPQVAQELNEAIIRHGLRGQLVSIVMMLLDPRTRKARICRAGSVKMLRFKGGALSVFDEALGPHLGAFSGVSLKEVEMQFAPGDSLALMTDGINMFADRKNFLLDNLTEKLASRMGKGEGVNLADQVAALLKEKRAAAADCEVTVLGIQRHPKPDSSAPIK